jgi:hypothetical protein
VTEQGRSTELEDAGLPLTALAVAAARAVDTSRPDALVADRFAAALVVAARSHPRALRLPHVSVRLNVVEPQLKTDPHTATPEFSLVIEEGSLPPRVDLMKMDSNRWHFVTSQPRGENLRRAQ